MRIGTRDEKGVVFQLRELGEGNFAAPVRVGLLHVLPDRLVEGHELPRVDRAARTAASFSRAAAAFANDGADESPGSAMKNFIKGKTAALSEAVTPAISGATASISAAVTPAPAASKEISGAPLQPSAAFEVGGCAATARHHRGA